jgi:hypothetical protein
MFGKKKREDELRRLQMAENRRREAARRESAALSKQYDREQREFTRQMEESRRLANREESQRRKLERSQNSPEDPKPRGARPRGRKTPPSAAHSRTKATKSTGKTSNASRLQRDFPNGASELAAHVRKKGFLSRSQRDAADVVWNFAQRYLLWLDNGDNDLPVDRTIRRNVTERANTTIRGSIEDEAWIDMGMLATGMSRFEIALAIRCASMKLGAAHISSGAAGDNYAQFVEHRDRSLHNWDLVDADTSEPTPLM